MICNDDPVSDVLTGVWADLVGQEKAVEVLRRAAESQPGRSSHAMSHAWLITGPPGSGRSNAAADNAMPAEPPCQALIRTSPWSAPRRCPSVSTKCVNWCEERR